jgi:hypothetical protein
MKMSSCRPGLEGGPVAQHRPQHVDPPASESDEGLGVPLALGPLALVEGPGLRGATQAGEGRVVEEDPLEDLIAPAHPTVVSYSLAGVAGGRDEPGVSGELVGALKSREVSCGDQELSSEDRTHPRQASEDPSLGTGEKTPCKLLIEGLDALLVGENLSSKLGDDCGGDFFGGQDDALRVGRGEGLLREALSSFDAAVAEEGDEALATYTADGGGGLVVSYQGEGAPVVQVQRPLQGRKQRKKSFSEAGDGAGLVGDEIPATAGDEELQLGKLSFAGCEFAEVRSHARLIGDDVSVSGVGVGLPAVGIASPIHGKAWKVENPLASFPQQCQKERRGATWLVDGPNDFLGQGEDLIDEKRSLGLRRSL